MTEKIEDLIQFISAELGELHLKWLLFSQLYEDEKTVDLLNDSAPTFFGFCQNIFLNDIILSISRLTDPPKIGSKENLTLGKILDSIDPIFSQLKAELVKTLETVDESCDFARKHRNRRIAHTDLKTHFQDHPELLSSITKEKIEKALLSLRTFVNKVELHFTQKQMGYEYLTIAEGSSSLIGCLRDAKSYRDQYGDS